MNSVSEFNVNILVRLNDLIEAADTIHDNVDKQFLLIPTTSPRNAVGLLRPHDNFRTIRLDIFSERKLESIFDAATGWQRLLHERKQRRTSRVWKLSDSV